MQLICNLCSLVDWNFFIFPSKSPRSDRISCCGFMYSSRVPTTAHRAEITFYKVNTHLLLQLSPWRSWTPEWSPAFDNCGQVITLRNDFAWIFSHLSSTEPSARSIVGVSKVLMIERDGKNPKTWVLHHLPTIFASPQGASQWDPLGKSTLYYYQRFLCYTLL